MSDRKLELERKKAKLQAMRDEKKRKEEERKKKELEGAGAAQTPPPPVDLRSETEQMLKDLGIPPSVANASAPAAKQAQPSRAPDVPDGSTPSPQMPKKKLNLSVSKITQTNIPPKEQCVYSKETQTVGLEPAHADDGSTRSNSPSVGNSSMQNYGSPRFDFPNLEWEDEFSFQDEDTDSLDVAIDTPPVSAHGTKMPHPEMTKPAATPDEVTSPHEEEKPIPVLTEEEKCKIMMSEEYQKFIDRSARLIERAIYEDTDIFSDYTGEQADDREGGLAEGEKLKLSRQFYDERWSKYRTVTCMDWSVQHPELLVASYNNNEEAPHEPDGVALVWNIKYKKPSPEYIFHCQSSLMSACFAKFHPNLIIGGTYSGQIVLWDNRSNKRTPVQRTPLSAAAHTHPVYCVNVVGTQNAHNLISVSTDGKMCSWSLDMLSQPQDSMELQHKQSKAVAVTSFSFLSGDVNNFVVGSEEGTVYTACRHGSKAGINDMFEGHQGPVTGIDSHAVPGSIDFSPYFITSSFDWTVKLWNIKEQRPLHSFEDNSDYIYDAKWSPIHPALFATVDGMGRLDLWNLNHDTEVPAASVTVDNAIALNKCRWHQSGHSIAVGDDLGKIHVYDVGEPLAVPRNDEWSRFVHTLQEMKNNQADNDDDGGLHSSAPIR